MEVILLERIARLGGVGDVVSVKNGFARNYLIPQEKALRASNENKAVFESRRESLEAQNNERKTAAEKQASGMQDVLVTVVRQASDDGKLYGSVAVRDVAEALEAEGHHVDRRLIDLNQAIKSLGLYEVTVNLHPEVPVVIKVHVARNADSPIPQELLEEEEAPAPAMEAAAETEEATEAKEDDEETAA
jgi:large subunit ribosomal protein L9